MALATGPMDHSLITISTRTWGSPAQKSRKNGSLNLHEKSLRFHPVSYQHLGIRASKLIFFCWFHAMHSFEPTEQKSEKPSSFLLLTFQGESQQDFPWS